MSMILQTHLPMPDNALFERSQQCFQLIIEALEDAAKAHPEQGAYLPFDRFMELALYAPGVGYYTGNRLKLDSPNTALQASLEGDFTTAPELSPFFGYTLSNSLLSIMQAADAYHILEFGAGSGALAESILTHLNNRADIPSVQYYILELSPDLRARQAERLAGFGDQVLWLDTLPESFEGAVVANEVLDAMPVSVFHLKNGQLSEHNVSLDDDGSLCWLDTPASPYLQALYEHQIKPLWEKVYSDIEAPTEYLSEFHPHAQAWIQSMGTWLKKGAALLIDYGHEAAGYYHPTRTEGTLMAHFQHLAHNDVLLYPGIQDMTAHVNFSAIAQAAMDAGLHVYGYTSQADYLIDAGLFSLLESQLDPSDVAQYSRAIAPIQRLINPADMGEVFKVMCLCTTNLPESTLIVGFEGNDARGYL